MDEPDHIPTPLEAMTDALVGAGLVIGRILGHMMHSQAVTGRTDPPIPVALHDILLGVIEPMEEHREFELGVAAQVLSDALVLIMGEIELMPIDAPRTDKPRRRL